jgi:hypothetical protein
VQKNHSLKVPALSSRSEFYTAASENFALTLCIVRLLVKAVAGGASKGSGNNKQHLLRACSPGNGPEALQQFSNECLV